MKSDLVKALLRLLEERYGEEIFARWYRNPFKILIGCVLSQRSREENTEAACKALFGVASSPREILGIPQPTLRRLIKPAGLAGQKSQRIRKISEIILRKYGGHVPKNREALMELPGVGPKTANVVLCYGFGVPCIPVDTHVNRISRRLGFVSPEAKIEEVEPTLQKIFPKDKWRILNRGLVLFGREICLPRNPRCGVCPIAQLCKTGREKLKGGS